MKDYRINNDYFISNTDIFFIDMSLIKGMCNQSIITGIYNPRNAGIIQIAVPTKAMAIQLKAEWEDWRIDKMALGEI